jgi:hypothetical protein
MKTNNFDEIILKKRRNFKNLSSKQKKCIAFDTETLNGFSFLLGNSDNNYKLNNVNDLKISGDYNFSSFEDILSYLYSFNDSLNVFFNLEYDSNALLKHLSREHLEFFIQYNYTIYNNYYISGIPKKSLDISYAYKLNNIGYNYDTNTWDFSYIKNNKEVFKKYVRKPRIFVDIYGDNYILSKKVTFYDLWQFFKYEESSSLDNCSNKYLGEGKIDIESLGYDKSNLVLDDNIINYCLVDCDRTKKLCDMVINACNDIGILFNKPYSCATLAADYFFGYQNLRNPYYFLWQYGKNISQRNKDIFRYAYYSYKGGRTEVTKKGYYEDVKEYDVNSMYPYHMSKLYDIFKCSWKKITSENELLKINFEDIAYGFLKCKIIMYKNYINPLPFKFKGYYVYGYGIFNEYYITLPEYELIKKYNLGNITIIDGWIGLKEDSDLIFKNIINNIFTDRKKYPKTDFRNSLFKIILNSMYGKFIEVNINKENKDNCDIDLLNDDYYITDNDVIVKSFLAGKYFCPVYAAYITALSRCKVYEAAYLAEDNFIATFTDSVMSLEKLDFLKTGNNLGEWEYNEGDLTMIGAGIYRLEADEEKLRTRGFHIKENINDLLGWNNISLDDILWHGLDQTKVKKLKESYIQEKQDLFNTFVVEHKTVNLNFDKKRDWNSKFNCVQDCYTQSDSKMLNIDNLS